MTMTAQSGSLRTDPEENVLIVELHNGTIEIGDYTAVFPDTERQVIPLPDATNSRTEATGPSQLPLAVIPGEKVRQRERVNRREQELAAKAAFQMLTGDFDALASPLWFVELARLRDEDYRYHRLETEPHRRWANGFSCLCFVLVGAPLAIRLRNADFLTSFFLCFLPILIVYYPLLAYGVDRAKNGAMRPETVWLGNVILLVVGGWLLRKVLRY
jgi:lipopolysaccharide export system permease protein